MVRDSHLPNSSNLLLQRTPNTHTHRHTDTQKNRVKTMNFNEPTRSRRPPRAMVRKTTAGNDFFGNGWICMDLHGFAFFLCIFQEECQNYIRVMTVKEAGRLLLCGTHAFKPMCREYVYKVRRYRVLPGFSLIVNVAHFSPAWT